MTPCCARVFFEWYKRFKEGYKEVKDNSKSGEAFNKQDKCEHQTVKVGGT